LQEDICEISGFRSGVAEFFALMGFNAAWVGSCLAMFRYSLSVPSSRVKAIDPETSLKNYHLTMH